MKALTVTASIVIALAVIAVAANYFIARETDNRIAVAAQSGTRDGQSRGDQDGAAEGQSTGINEGTAAGAEDGAVKGSADGSLEGTLAGGDDGEADGSTDGLQDGIGDGSLKGKVDGYEDGKSAGLAVGYEDGFEQGTGAGYLVRNPTYEEAVDFMAKTTASTAAAIVTEADAGSIRAGYVAFKTADLTTGYYEMVVFETVDEGLIYFTSAKHVQVELELGKRYSTLNGYVSPTDDTITKITVFW